jgi:hypothetical protein
MASWSRLRAFVARKKEPPSTTNPFSGVCWVPAGDNPFGVELLDCRSVSQSMLSVTTDSHVADTYAALRGSRGEQYRGHSPEDSRTCKCDLRYPHKGETRDGPLFKAQVMEDKWDIYLYDGDLYFAKSWTGELEYRAMIVFREDAATVIAVEARKALLESDPFYPVAVVDFLIRSHLYRLPVPHPLPKSIAQEPWRLAMFSFVQYGRYALFGTFADTTQLHLPAQERAGGPDV